MLSPEFPRRGGGLYAGHGILSQSDNKKPEELELEFDHFDLDNSYPTSPFKGRNIVDLDFVYKQLLDGHKACKATLSLT